MVAEFTKNQNQESEKKIPFFKMTVDHARADYKAKRITAEAYILYIVKVNRAAGWKWKFKVDAFCGEYEIPRRSFYRAISKLKTQDLLHWETNDVITLWWGSDIAADENTHSSVSANSQNVVPAMAVPSVAQAVPSVAVPVPSVAVPVPSVALPVPSVAQQNAETLTVTESCNAPYSLHISNKHTTHNAPAAAAPFPTQEGKEQESVCVNEVFEEEEKERTGKGVVKDPPSVESPKKVLSPKPKVPHEGQSSAAPLNKNSQNLGKSEWVCCGNAEQKKKFLKFKGQLMVEAGLTNSIEASTRALAWANKNPEEAGSLYESWLEMGEPSSSRNLHEHKTVEIPDFDKMESWQHFHIWEIYQHTDDAKFLARCAWYADWLGWLKKNKPERVKKAE